MKDSQICPIFKKNEHSLVSNYRPNSLLCLIHKVLESFLFKDFFLVPSVQLSKSQFWLKKPVISYTTQFSSCIQEIFNSHDNKSQSCNIFQDFSKAFDSLPHAELHYKLCLLDITGSLYCCFHDYLTNK